MEDAPLIAIGRIAKVRGIRGEVKVHVYSGRPESLEGREILLVQDSEGRVAAMNIARFRSDPTGVYLTFAGVDSRTAAKHLLRREVVIPQDELRTLATDEYFQFQLIGLRVMDTEGRDRGHVVAVRENPAHDLLVIRQDGVDHLVPAIKAFIRRIDLDAGILHLQTIDGLLEE